MRTGLPSDLGEAVQTYLDAFPRGDVVAFPIHGLDRIGLPVWVVALFPEDAALDGIMPYGVGYGATDEAAVLGGLGEIAEMVWPTLTLGSRAKTRGSYAELVRALGERAVADPLTLCLPAGSPVGRDTVLDWVEATRWADGSTVLVPIDLAAYSAKELSPGYRPFTTIISNGMGAGPDLDWAIGHGLCEILQRDGNGLVFRALDRGVTLDGVDSPLLGRFVQAGIRLIPKFATDQFGLPNLYCVGVDEAGELAAPITATACGEACHPDATAALEKCVTEYAASRARKAFAHGPAELVRQVAPEGYVERFMAQAGGAAKSTDARAFRAMQDWTRQDAATLRGWLAETMLAERASRDFSTLPSTPAPTGHDRSRVTRAAVEAAGFDILYVDMSPPDRAVSVVKVIVPGMEVETMSYYRIGERNTRKLLDMGSPLIRFAGESDTVRPVRLTPEALDRFGRQPLFDTAAAAAIVGPLYPLYREPEAHHVAWAEARVTLRFAYNTNGAANHRLDDAVRLIADSGYQGVALTLDHHHLDPFAEAWWREADRVGGLLDGLGLGSVIETGARYLLDPREKHEPTLVSADGRERRIAFLNRAIDIAAILGSETVSFWAGVPKPGVDHEQAWRWLNEGLEQVLAHAADKGVLASFEPEPGMLVETVADYDRLAERHPTLRLALDTGHCLVTQDIDPADAVRRYADRLGTVAIEDMRRGDHTHLPFGQGDMDMPAVLAALADIGFDKLACVELSRESPRAHRAIPEAIAYLKAQMV